MTPASIYNFYLISYNAFNYLLFYFIVWAYYRGAESSLYTRMQLVFLHARWSVVPYFVGESKVCDLHRIMSLAVCG